MKSKKSNSNVLVIVINYNQLDYTLNCIQSILKSNFESINICLVDNGSDVKVKDGLRARLPEDSRLDVHFLERNLGYVGGINYALSCSDEELIDYYLIINNDTLLDKEAISNLVECAKRHNDKAIVSGKVYNFGSDNTLQYIGQEKDPKDGLNQVSIISNRNEPDLGQYDEEREMGMLDDIFWLFPSSLYRSIGGYSDYFFLYGEQNDYAFRALKEGYKLIYTPTAKVHHKGGASTCGGDKSSPKIEYWGTMATLKLAVIHLPPNKAKKFCRNWIYRKFIKTLFLAFLGRIKWMNLVAVYKAQNDFKHWNKVRYVDNGYNPFS
ncbi:glycosyltransferase family 2 protein [Pseudidiomarina taiwanensis]|uniref:Glycosyltransferase 2-like domain-containing protein n=1 Tax=Pseudidiomarina taiwanensis TaxID=337250 RepID=A0A432ZKB4_9GAMM|nr:glycosyltransferase family 2 protein [Pseudidiomarina taiwanensis]RUO78411.1 hypothetical protein CWI83_05120 [Pseudidiomarina taiwanensis]